MRAHHLERIAHTLDETMTATAAADSTWTPWEHVEWLRLQADLLDRLAAAAGPGHPLSGRAALLRDEAERMADRLNRVPAFEPDPVPHPTGV
ncbi:hypothetical protein [Saccharothrix coeruleofusca]|uniref:Uncharacterized protein n=1 Tax=Saccharothrix coeruleofusca TaxID=33919 RepID=A0A918AGW6_9PSEU|nr:hypothetical protein [Saccharothrix coeruleofusca]MBP2340520.1 hypothetical protein [Saccharothrix coeruleofusca]GGP34875.1 hypothetical protein GCM10010185_02000 [Saccharothrix coeruleofusca]